MNALRIDPEAYYGEDALRVSGIDGDSLRRAREAGELRSKKVGKQVLYKGEWVRQWLDRDEEKGGGS